jgi:hypothetical protein
LLLPCLCCIFTDCENDVKPFSVVSFEKSTRIFLLSAIYCPSQNGGWNGRRSVRLPW